MSERRQDPRKLTCILAGYAQEPDQHDHIALLSDLSARGAKIYTRHELSAGTRLDLALHLDADMEETSPAIAKVVHCERRPWEGSDFWTWEAGIEFEESLEKYGDAIEALHARMRAAGVKIP